jgi:hypothetical protein
MKRVGSGQVLAIDRLGGFVQELALAETFR